MRIIGYVRTSTDEQNNGLEAQQVRLQEEARDRSWELTMVSEQASGKTLARRPRLQGALAALAKGEFDGMVVTKLDRLARSVLDFAAIINRASTESWALVCLDLALDTSTPNGRFTAHVLAAVAQLERDLISQRTREALAVIKARGVVLGRQSTIDLKLVDKVKKLRNSGKSWREIVNATGLPLSTVRRVSQRGSV